MLASFICMFQFLLFSVICENLFLKIRITKRLKKNMSKAEDDFSCPICLDTLKPPIRITYCGHNFCEECLKSLCSSSKQQARLVCF